MPPEAWHLDSARRHGRSSLTYSTLDPRLSRFTADGTEGYVAYAEAGKTMLALGGPVCAPKHRKALVLGYADEAEARGKRPVFFAVHEECALNLEDMGFRMYRAARDSMVDLDEFTTSGNRMLNVRRGYNHARNVGLTWREYRPADGRDRELESQCDAISSEWLEAKGGLEIEFILGRADWGDPGDRRFFVAESGRGVEGFLVYHPAYNLDGWYLDMSRRHTDSPNGTMDFLLVETLGKFREEGAKRAFLGMIPDITFPAELEDAGPIVRRVMKALAGRAEFFYPVRSETFFKNKYHPEWEDLYLCTRDEISLGLLHDMLLAFQPGGVVGMVGRRLRGNGK